MSIYNLTLHTVAIGAILLGGLSFLAGYWVGER
jgi:hypothetical protein